MRSAVNTLSGLKFRVVISKNGVLTSSCKFQIIIKKNGYEHCSSQVAFQSEFWVFHLQRGLMVIFVAWKKISRQTNVQGLTVKDTHSS